MRSIGFNLALLPVLSIVLQLPNQISSADPPPASAANSADPPPASAANSADPSPANAANSADPPPASAANVQTAAAPASAPGAVQSSPSAVAPLGSPAPAPGQVAAPQNGLSPIILIPGLGGSRLEADLNKSKVVSMLCTKKQKGASIWPPLKGAIPGIIKCWSENVKLMFNNLTKTVSDNIGVKVLVPGFGTVDKSEYLAEPHLPPTAYLHDLVDAAVKWGYVRNKNIKAAPYDFRKSPDLSQEYLAKLEALVKSTSAENGNLPVTIIAHSLGAIHTLYWLQRQSPEWKKQYIKRYIVMGGPFAGAVQTVRAIVSGYNFGVITVDNEDIRVVQRTWPTIYALLPKPGIGVWNESIVQKGTSRSYFATEQNYMALFQDMKSPDALAMYERNAQAKFDPTISPGVPTTCIFGVGLKTPRALHFKKEKDFPDDNPEDIMADGDGTVVTSTTSICQTWAKSGPVESKTFDKAEHIAMVKEDKVHAYLKEVILAKP